MQSVLQRVDISWASHTAQPDHIMAPQLFRSNSSLRRKASNSSRHNKPTKPTTSSTSSSEEHYQMPSFLNQSDYDLYNNFTAIQEAEVDRMYAASSSTDPTHPYAVLQGNPETASRDRYSNVVPFANSRVVLKVAGGQCDYINASPIKLREEGTGVVYNYIAAQGPKQEGVSEFWQMVFQESGAVAVVVMLTSVVENGREKCAQYFPVDSRQATMELRAAAAQQDPFVDDETAAMARSCRNGSGASPPKNTTTDTRGTISLLETEWCEAAHSIIRTFRLTFGDTSKTVYHYHFQNWPDHGHPQPQDRDAILALSRMTAERAGTPCNPRIVHCSAGVGRTGTFIALDHLLRALRSGALLTTSKRGQSERQEVNAHAVLSDRNVREKDVVYNTVDRLRRQRMYMVFTGVQYRFIHEVLREQALSMLNPTKDSKGATPDPSSRSARTPRDAGGGGGYPHSNIDTAVAAQADPYARAWQRPHPAPQPTDSKIIRRGDSTVVVTTDAHGRVTEYTTDRISAQQAATRRACVAAVPPPGLCARAQNRSPDSASGSGSGASDTSSLRARRLKKMPKLAGVMPPRLSISSDSDHSLGSSAASVASEFQGGEREDAAAQGTPGQGREQQQTSSGSARSTKTGGTQGSDGSWDGSPGSAGATAKPGAMVA